MTSAWLLNLAILMPMVAVPLIGLCHNRPNLREAVTLSTAAATLICVLLLYLRFMSGDSISAHWLTLFPGLDIAFDVEALGMIFALVAGFLWVVTSVYAIGYMRGNSEKHQTRFFMLFPVAISAALGIAFAKNLVTLFLFYEIMTLSTFPLVTHKGNADAIKSGRIYLGVLMSSSIVLLLPAIAWVWQASGTTDFTVGGVLRGNLDGAQLTILGLMFLLGIGKAAVMPMHRWLPAAMVAPTPVSALLHAVAVVKAGVFSLLKVNVYVLGIDHMSLAPNVEWLLYIGCFTVVISSVIALQQDNLKRRLAYSTISQLSYIVVATLLLTPISVVGAAMHIAAHAFGKITLFFAAGSIYTASKKTEISQINGIGRRMPFTMAAFSIGGLSMIGIPPMVGFVSKWFILKGAFEAEHLVVLFIILLSTLLNAAYFVPIVYRAYMIPEAPGQKPHGEAPLPMVGAFTMTAAMTISLFFFPEITHQLAELIEVRP